MPHWQPSFFSFVCELETDLMAPLPPPPSPNSPNKFSSSHMRSLLCGVKSRAAQTRTCLASPQNFKPLKNAGFKCRLCFRCLPHPIVMRYIVGFNFNFCVTGNNASVAFKNNLFSIAIFHQCLKLKSKEKMIFKKNSNKKQ